jgi:hypothetical protein
VVVAIGANEVGKDLRVAPVGLGPARRVSFAVAGGGEGVDGIDLVAGGHQRGDEQAAVGLDADDDLVRSLHVFAEQGVQHRDAVDALDHPPGRQHPTLDVEHAHVVVSFGPVDTHEDRQARTSLSRVPEPQRTSRRANGPVLCRHVTPAAISTVLADRRGHALSMGLDVLRNDSAHPAVRPTDQSDY